MNKIVQLLMQSSHSKPTFNAINFSFSTPTIVTSEHDAIVAEKSHILGLPERYPLAVYLGPREWVRRGAPGSG